MRNLLLIGDSFAANQRSESWINFIENYQVTNISSNGASQYRLFKKLQDSDLSKFDAIIMVHTSPNRVYVDHNPLHGDHHDYAQCDLIYADVKDKQQNSYAKNVTWWFENVFDVTCARDIHKLLVESCCRTTANIINVHVSFFELGLARVHDLNNIWKKNPGSINHLSKTGNLEVARIINKLLQ